MNIILAQITIIVFACIGALWSGLKIGGLLAQNTN